MLKRLGIHQRTVAAWLLAVLVSGCAVGPDYARPALALPETWPWQRTGQAQTQRLPLDWWRSFNDPVLTRLVEDGLRSNDDLALAAARVAEARATLRLYQADLYPSLSLQGSAARTSNSEESIVAGFPSSSKPFNSFGISAVLNYELDLWGRLRRVNEAARAALLAEQANADTVRLAVVSDIAGGYFNLLGLQAQRRITVDTIAGRREFLSYQRKQFDVGVIDALTLRRAESELAVAEAQLPLLQQASEEQLTALGVLLGRSPAELTRMVIVPPRPAAQQLAALPVPPLLPRDTPASLLNQRPDIRVAEESLRAANADIGVARAAYLPRVSLAAVIGLQSSDADRLFRGSARTWQLGADAAMPLLDFGRTQAGVDAANARQQQALANYGLVVRSAYKDVLDATKRTASSMARFDALQRNTTALNDALRVANARYGAGYSTYLDALDAQRALYQSQLDEIDARVSQLNATVQLYKALGGGWQLP